MGYTDSPAMTFLAVLVPTSAILICVVLRIDLGNFPVLGMSRTKLFLATAVLTLLLISAFAYTSYVMRRETSTAIMGVDPPKSPPKLPALEK